MSNKTNLPLKYLVLIAVIVFGAWFHFPWAFILLIAYIIAALLFKFTSNTGLVAGVFLILLNLILPTVRPESAQDINISTLRVYGAILIVFWLAMIIDKRVNIFIVGEEGKLKETKKIIIETDLDKIIIKKSVQAFFAALRKGLKRIFGGLADFGQKSVEAMKQAPNLSAKIWIGIKSTIGFFRLLFRRIFQLIWRGVKALIGAIALIVKKIIRLIFLIVKGVFGILWRIVKWICKSFVDFWRSLFRFLVTNSRLRNIIFKTIGLIIFFYCLGNFTDLVLFEILTWMFLAAAFIFSWDSRISIGVALALLLICPILLSLKETQPLAELVAEALAVYAYYFLVIGVALQIREYWREGRKGKSNPLIKILKFKIF